MHGLQLLRKDALRKQVEEDDFEPTSEKVTFAETCRLVIDDQLPISHLLSHFPKNCNCPACIVGRAERLPIVLCDHHRELKGERIHIYADFVGKVFPLAGTGEKWGYCIGSSLGHRSIDGMQTKTAPAILDQAQVFLHKLKIPVKGVPWFQDTENATLLRDFLLENEADYGPGVANRKNSHGKAETNLRYCGEGLRATLYTAQTPFKYWVRAGRTWSENFCVERGLSFGNYVAPERFVFGEVSCVRLESATYSPPVVSPKGTQCMFIGYGTSHAVNIEFFDVNVGKRRATQTTAASFFAGLPKDGKRPQFAFSMKQADSDRLTSVFKPILEGEENEKAVGIPQEKSTPLPAGRPKAAAKPKSRRKKRSSENARLVQQEVEQVVDDDEIECELSFFVEVYGDPTAPDNDNIVPSSSITEDAFKILAESELDPQSFPDFECVVNLGRPESDDMLPGRHPLEVTVGEVETCTREPREGRQHVRIAKVVSEKETKTTFAHLDWPSAWRREGDKYFVKFHSLSLTANELIDPLVGSYIVRFFPIRTIKNYENPADHVPSIRIAAAGNNVQFLGTNRTWKKAPSVRRKQDTVEAASVESQRCFFVTQTALERVFRQDDADGFYLQFPYNTNRRPGKLFGILPKNLIPPGHAAHQMRCPCFEVTGSVYGLEESGFESDEGALRQMKQHDWHSLDDIDSAISINAKTNPLNKDGLEGEPIYEEIEPYDHAAMRYVDDFITASVPNQTPPPFGLAMKPCEGGLTKFIGQQISLFNAEDGSRNMVFSQIAYVDKALEDFKDILSKKKLPALRCYEVPAVKETPDNSTAGVLFDGSTTTGLFSSECSSLVQSLQFIARLTRPDIVFAVTRCSRYLTRWTVQHDRWLIRIYGYLQGTTKFCLHFVIFPADLQYFELLVFFDADLAGCLNTRRSTTGVFAVLWGPHTWAPLLFLSKRQGQVGLSTPESETLSGITAYKRVTRLSMLVNVSLRREVPVRYFGDNTAAEGTPPLRAS